MSELTKVDNGKVTLKLHISGEDYVKALDSAYRRLGHNFRIPGFRRGKAARRIIEQHYGNHVFQDDEFDALIQKAYSDAIEEHKLMPEIQPRLVFDSFSEENGVDFTADVVLHPEVKLGQYKGIEVPDAEYNVTDDDVNAEILRRRQALASTESVERPVENGDTVVLDFAGYLGDEQFEGGTASNYTLKIGSHAFIPGFEEQMIGMKIGESRDLNVTFPEDYQAEHLAGKEVVFKVVVHSISVDKLPEFDNDFVMDTSEFNTTEEYTANVRSELEAAAAERAKQERINNIVQKAIDNAEVDIHEDILNEEVDAQLRRFNDQLRSFGTNLDDYISYAKLSIDDIRKDYYEGAKRNLKAQYVLLAIIEAEKIEPNDDDYRSVIRSSEPARREKWNDEKINAELEKNRMRYATNALYEATFRFLTENAVSAPAAK